jgi:hypothetical protein
MTRFGKWFLEGLEATGRVEVMALGLEPLPPEKVDEEEMS